MRPRKPKNRGLPPNLYEHGGYYRYRRPDTKVCHGFGTDKAKAIRAANELNARLTPAVDLVARVLGGGRTLSDAVDAYMSRHRKPWSAATHHQRDHCAKVVKERIGLTQIQDVSVETCATFIQDFKPRMGQVIRAFLVLVLKDARAAGWIDSNPADATLKPEVTVERRRLTLEDFWAIHGLCEPLYQRALKLALVTLQRREDLCAMRFRDYQNGQLRVIQKKTGTALAIELDKALIDACRDDAVSAFLLHQKTTKGRARAGAPLHPDLLSRAFAEARDKTRLSKLPARQRPTFHEIRALGAHLYRQQGIDPQALLGHRDARMTTRYLTGHQVEWMEVKASLSL